jgi:hypothetical protein
MRLGKFNGNMFDTNVGKDTFQKIMKGLCKYQGWEDIKDTVTTSYYKGNTRMTIDEGTNETVVVEKTKIDKVDYSLKESPLDIRFSVAVENPVEQSDDEVMDFVRHKKRKSFVRKNLSIDMTVVTGDPDDIDDESEESYEIEMEIVNPKLVTSDTVLYNIIYKIECLMKLLKD